MTVRAKMTLSNVEEGSVGFGLHFGAVYEGSNELQAMSENAIFGKATPMGTAVLFGRDCIAAGDEFYFDFLAPDDVANGSPLILADVRKTFRGWYNRDQPNQLDRFNFAVTSAHCSGSIQLSIANAVASEYFDRNQIFQLAITRAGGTRRSDAEIALRRDMLEKARANPWSRRAGASPDELAQIDRNEAAYIVGLEKKLARAEGRG